MKIPAPRLTSTTLAAFAALFFTLLNYAFFAEALRAHPFRGESGDWFLLTLPFFIFFFINIFAQLLALPFLHRIIMPALIVIGAAISWSSIFLKVYFSREILNNVLQATSAETLRVLSPSYAIWVVVFGIAPALLYLLVKVQWRSLGRELGWRMAWIVFSALGMAGIAWGFYQDYASFFRNNHGIMKLVVPSNFVGAALSKARMAWRARIPYTRLDVNARQLPPAPGAKRRVAVIIVGETARAQNWGLNGYARQTTPRLAARSDIINFTQVSSCGTDTATSVPCMFSVMDRAHYDEAHAEMQDNLMDIFQRAGVYVYWVDNNTGCKGVCNRIPNELITHRNLPEYCQGGECMDDILLTDFDKLIDSAQEKDAVLVLHTIGSHGPAYYARYTPEYRQFTPTCDTNEIHRCTNEELVNTYDNTLLYTDKFIADVIGRLEKRTDMASMVFYASDHGESLGENGIYLHGTPRSIAPKEQTRIPMIFWFSPAWLEEGDFDIQCLRQRAQSGSYSQDNFYSTLYALMRLDTQAPGSTWQQALDIIQPCRRAGR